jgi:hypothetical protein
MPRIKDLTGQRFNKLTAVSDSGIRSSNRSIKWNCVCDCGNFVQVESGVLLGRRQQSCGCIMKGVARHMKHGHSQKNRQSATYRTWANMKQRCTNPLNHKYKNYGLRGIEICPEWLDCFETFAEEMGEKPEGMTLERRDVNKGYSKSNCYWADAKAQANNKTNNRLITHEGKTMTTSEWADHLGIKFSTLRMRLHRNWPTERALK